MGRVRLHTDYEEAVEDADALMEGCKDPSSVADTEKSTEPVAKHESDSDLDEESKDGRDSSKKSDSKYSNLPTIDQLLTTNGVNLGMKIGGTTTEDVEMMDEEAVEPNSEFVKQFDHFGSFTKAAGFIEDWIRSKKNNATDFTNDFPAVIERGKQIRKIILKMRDGNPKCTLNQNGAPENPEIRNVHQLIFTKHLCESEDAYIYHFTINLIEACCGKYEVPLLIIRIAINHVGILISDGKLELTQEMRGIAKEKLGSLRAEVVFDFVKQLGLKSIVSDNYFLELAQENYDNARFAEAAVLIIKFRFFEKFDVMQLIYELVDQKRLPTAKLLIDQKPDLKEKVVRLLSTNTHAKTAADLVKDYKLNPEDFPELQAIISRNSSSYFIGRAFRAPSHADYMPLHKIEDLFTNNHRMLTELV